MALTSLLLLEVLNVTMLIVILVTKRGSIYAMLCACLLAAVFKSTSQAVSPVEEPHLLLDPVLSSGVSLLMLGLQGEVCLGGDWTNEDT